MEKLFKDKLKKLHDSLAIAAETNDYAEALRLIGAIFHIEWLRDELRDAGHICTNEFADDKETS